MGKAGRWFKGLLGIKKEPKQIESSAEKEGKEGSTDSSAKPPKHRQRRWSFGVKASAVGGDHQHPNEDGTKEPKLSSGNYNFGGSERAKAGTNKQILAPRSSASAVPYPSTYLDSDVAASSAPLSTSTTTTSAPPPTSSSSSSATQSKETIVTISHITAKGGPMKDDEGFSEEEEIGAIRIQTAFRGYLARKALNALRGLVKLQALVRGHIVRKQAKETLKCMHALVKIQTQITANRAKILEIGHHGSLQRRPNDQRRRLHDGSESSSQDENWRREMDMGRSKCGAPRKKGLMAGAMSDSYCTNPSTCSTADSYRIPSPQRQRQHRLSRVAVPRPQSTELASSQEYDNEVAHTGYLDGTESVYSTFQNSPVSKHSRMSRGPLRSEYAESLIDGYAGFPSYMANTQSSRAKVRSQSAPRQRPSTSSQSSASRKRMTIHETSDGARMQRSSSQVPPLRKGLNYHGGSTGSQMHFDNRSVISIRDDDYDTMSLVSGRF